MQSLELLICGIQFYVLIHFYTWWNGRIITDSYTCGFWMSYRCSPPEPSAEGCLRARYTLGSWHISPPLYGWKV